MSRLQCKTLRSSISIRLNKNLFVVSLLRHSDLPRLSGPTFEAPGPQLRAYNRHQRPGSSHGSAPILLTAKFVINSRYVGFAYLLLLVSSWSGRLRPRSPVSFRVCAGCVHFCLVIRHLNHYLGEVRVVQEALLRKLLRLGSLLSLVLVKRIYKICIFLDLVDFL